MYVNELKRLELQASETCIQLIVLASNDFLIFLFRDKQERNPSYLVVQKAIQVSVLRLHVVSFEMHLFSL